LPGERSGRSTAILYEDDGISVDGPLTLVTLTLEWNETEVRVGAAVSGDHALPYREMRVIPPPGEARAIELTSAEPREPARDSIALLR
jgi:hypothetical protein